MTEMLIDGTKFTGPEADLAESISSPLFQSAIHPADNMVVKGAAKSYYWMGRTALDSIQAAQALTRSRPPRRILDFPSGYGRVLRWLRYAWPEAEITACDIDRAGVDFCATSFQAVPVYSSIDVKEVRLGGQYDLIWVGSLFTHLTEDSAKDLFDLFHSVLAPGGMLLFSIAGEFVYNLAFAGDHGGVPAATVTQMKEDVERTGFAFGAYKPGIVQESNYGRAFIAKTWLARQLKEYPDLSSAAYIHRGYARRQDVIAWKKTD